MSEPSQFLTAVSAAHEDGKLQMMGKLLKLEGDICLLQQRISALELREAPSADAGEKELQGLCDQFHHIFKWTPIVGRAALVRQFHDAIEQARAQGRAEVLASDESEATLIGEIAAAGVEAGYKQGLERAAEILLKNHPDGESSAGCDIECVVLQSVDAIRAEARKK
jgi:hypothetical protein